ncbi:MAG: dUTP diphosphatase [Acidobacteriota bacterium]|nr:dUTP diphosphatase [Acidobacteriota bacterium]
MSGAVDVRVEVKVLPHGRDLPLPAYATEGSAGLDLRAAVKDEIVLDPGERTLVPTGLELAIPAGYEGQVRARSGVALVAGVGLPNAPGTIDSDYRGELKVLLINWSNVPHVIRRGERIAQLVIAPVARATLAEVEELPGTSRSSGGFGHTGRE